MSNTLKLENLCPSTRYSPALTDLIVGLYYSKINKEGTLWQARTLKAKIRKGRTKRNPNGHFDLFLDTFDEFLYWNQTLGEFAEFSGCELVFWVGGNCSKNTKQIKRIKPELTI